MLPLSIEKPDRPFCLAFSLIALIQGIILLAVSYLTADRHFMLPLDDAYIHLQYARQLSQFQPLIYTPGMEASGGMTSPLFVLLLTPIGFLGLNGVSGALASAAFGLLQWMLLPVWIFQLLKHWTDSIGGTIGALLVLAHGHLLWSFLSGMETGLFTLFLVGILLSLTLWIQEENRPALTIALILSAGLPLLRPEGFLMTVFIAGFLLIRGRSKNLVPVWQPIVILLPFFLWLFLLQSLTGTWKPAGLQTRGLNAFPYYSLLDKFSFASGTLESVILRFYQNFVPHPDYAAFRGLERMPYVAPLLPFFALLGGAIALVSDWRARKLTGPSLALIFWGLGIVSLCASFFPHVHHQRYYVPWTALMICMGVLGTYRISKVFANNQQVVFKGIGLLFILISLPSVLFWSREHGLNARDLYHQHRVATFSLGEIPENQPIALTDAGILAWYSNRPVIDLIGLATPNFAPLILEGESSILAELEEWREERPSYLFTYRNWWGGDFPLDSPKNIFHIARTTITSGTDFAQFPILWERIDAARFPNGTASPAARQILNVGNLNHERELNYHFNWGPYDVDKETPIWPQPLSAVRTFEISVNSPTPTTPTLRTRTPEFLADGARVVRNESFDLPINNATSVSSGTLLLYRADTAPAAIPYPHAKELEISLVSDTTGYRASRVISLKSANVGENTKSPDSLYEISILELMEEAGGRKWRVDVRSANPPNGAWMSFRYWILEPE